MSTDGAWESEKKMCSSAQMALTCTSVPSGLRIKVGRWMGSTIQFGEFSDLLIRGNNLNGINTVLPTTVGGFIAEAALLYSLVTCPFYYSVQQISHMWLP